MFALLKGTSNIQNLGKPLAIRYIYMYTNTSSQIIKVKYYNKDFNRVIR